MMTAGSQLSDARIIVAGAGCFGAAIALELSRRGAAAILADPNPTSNTSAMAAGMLAPALECVFDPQAAGDFKLLKEARDLWPAFAGDAAMGLQKCGAVLRGDEPFLANAFDRLRRVGAAAERGAGDVFTPEDWRLSPPLALEAMRAELRRRGGRIDGARVIEAGPGLARLSDNRSMEADAVVLACGFSGLDLAPELSVLSPIKGQLLRFEGGPSAGPILRGEGGYLVPSASGAVVGATMEPGRSDNAVDPDATVRLRDAAARLSPDLGDAPANAATGVRPATPDGLPMIGRSRTGMWLATGARRNGWLYGPLAARLIAEGIAGAADDPRLSPARFSPPD